MIELTYLNGSLFITLGLLILALLLLLGFGVLMLYHKLRFMVEWEKERLKKLKENRFKWGFD